MKSYRLHIYHLLVLLMPATRLFHVKRALLRWAGATIGNNVRIVSSAKFYLTGQLIIGENTWVGHEVLIVGGDAPVCIGQNVDIAPRVNIITGGHQPFGIPGKAAGEGYSKSIRIANGAWIGAASTILGGVSIVDASIVAAGALVRADVPGKGIVAGVPARPIRNSKTDLPEQ